MKNGLVNKILTKYYLENENGTYLTDFWKCKVRLFQYGQGLWGNYEIFLLWVS